MHSAFSDLLHSIVVAKVEVNMLKQSSDGLSKVWKVHKSNDPFYSGGKVGDFFAMTI